MARPLAVTAASLALAALLTFLALWRVAGVDCDGNDCSTSFDHAWAVLALLVVAVPIWWLGSRSRVLAFGLAGAGTVDQFVIAAVTVHRYDVSGFADGLETFAYVYAFLLGLVYLITATIAVARTSPAPSPEPGTPRLAHQKEDSCPCTD